MIWSILCRTGHWFELVRTFHTRCNYPTASTQAAAWIRISADMNMITGLPRWIQNSPTHMVYVCVYNPTRDPSVNSLIDMCRKGDSDITLMLVLPIWEKLTTSLANGRLRGHGDVKTTSDLHHWLSMVSAGQFKYIRLVIPLSPGTDMGEWTSLTRLTCTDLTHGNLLPV